MVVTNHPIPYRWRKNFRGLTVIQVLLPVCLFSSRYFSVYAVGYTILSSWARSRRFLLLWRPRLERPVAGRCETGEWRWRASCRWSIGHLVDARLWEPALGDRYIRYRRSGSDGPFPGVRTHRLRPGNVWHGAVGGSAESTNWFVHIAARFA